MQTSRQRAGAQTLSDGGKGRLARPWLSLLLRRWPRVSGVLQGDGHRAEGGDCGLLAELARSLSHRPGCALAFSAVAAVAGKHGRLLP